MNIMLTGKYFMLNPQVRELIMSTVVNMG